MEKLNTMKPLSVKRMQEDFDLSQERFEILLEDKDEKLDMEQKLIQFLLFETVRLQSCIIALDEKIEAMHQANNN